MHWPPIEIIFNTILSILNFVGGVILWRKHLKNELRIEDLTYNKANKPNGGE